MPGSTTRRSLPLPIGADDPSELRLSITAMADAVDSDPTFSSGTLASRPSSSSSLTPRIYLATDTGLYYWDTGAAWLTLMLLQSGSLASRPAAGSAGRFYYASDTKLFYIDNGTAWLTVLAAGAWVSLTLASGISAVGGAYTPAARLCGDSVELSGVLQNTSGSTITGNTTLATVPSSAFPASNVAFPGEDGAVNTAGDFFVPVSLTAAEGVNLDGLSYRLR